MAEDQDPSPTTKIDALTVCDGETGTIIENLGHVLKPRIGPLRNDLDLSDSVENEYYRLKLMEAFGVPVNQVKMTQFAEHKALVIERFDKPLLGQ